EHRGPDVVDMLAHCDAALIIGDTALLLDHQASPSGQRPIQKIDLGEAWKAMTGLPFVYAFWAGKPGALTAADVAALQRARDEGAGRADGRARAFFPGSAARQAGGGRYLRENIKFGLGPAERAALEAFYRYAAEAGVVADAGRLDFY